MAGPNLVCAGCSKPTSLYKPVCDDCLRLAGHEPMGEIDLQLLELGVRHGGRKHELYSAASSNEWNERVKFTDYVIVSLDDGTRILTHTRSQAWRLSSGHDVVLINDRSGGYSLKRVRAVIWPEPAPQ